MSKVILLRVEAPAKPATGTPCNGCGVCCASEPCPLGMVLSKARHGACRALVYCEDSHRYTCGLVTDARRWLPRSFRWGAPWASRLARRFIAAGSGCDSEVEIRVA